MRTRSSFNFNPSSAPFSLELACCGLYVADGIWLEVSETLHYWSAAKDGWSIGILLGLRQRVHATTDEGSAVARKIEHFSSHRGHPAPTLCNAGLWTYAGTYAGTYAVTDREGDVATRVEAHVGPMQGPMQGGLSRIVFSTDCGSA